MTSNDRRGEVTQILERVNRGEAGAANRLFPIVYEELRDIADVRMRRERPGHTLQATALVHELYIKLVADQSGAWQDSTHFIRASARAMRNLLIDYARKRARRPEGHGAADAVQLDIPIVHEFTHDQFEKLDEAIDDLGIHNQRWMESLLLRYYLDLSVEHTARLLEVGESTVKKDTRFALAWIRRRLEVPQE